ncbi:hypothetical protein HAX54_046157 [Datura stramonium]|uniref:Uncharacterized protein n=1 Tax=Datura stramonium TaxID=4076 RepID=A0ABS8WGJ9_DATST|nr:hypothetical protein [Datura stramonium]
MPILPTLENMPAASGTLPSSPSALFKEGTDVHVRCSQSHGGGTLLRANLCKFDDNHIVHNTTDFPFKVDIVVKRRSSCSTCKDHIYDHRTTQTFWIPYDTIFSDDASNITSKIICLMNVPFSLEKKQSIISSEIMNFARSMKNCPSNEDHWYMSLGITKVTYLPHMEFMNMYNTMGEYLNLNTWRKTQGVLDSRIAAFQLQNKIEIKKMRFGASEFKDSSLLDICWICRDEFLEDIYMNQKGAKRTDI